MLLLPKQQKKNTLEHKALTGHRPAQEEQQLNKPKPMVLALL
jgi:hypothetical protein